MYKTLSVLTLAASFAAPSLLAQETSPPPQALPAAPQPTAYKAVPFVDVAVGFDYLQTDLTDTPGGMGTYQFGWYGIPELHLTKHFAVLADFTDFSNYHAHQSDNVHGFTGGPAYTMGKSHGVSPYVFVEGGAVRNSHAGTIDWDPAAVGGFGMNMKLTHAISFQVIPGEYVATKLPNGNWQSNYTAKAGFVLTTFRWARIR